ncbi:MAG: hypothetical protein R2783_07505 [Gelidibacter sp.]
MKTIITRIWHGTTQARHADAYLDYLMVSGIKDYLSVKGNLSTKVLRRLDGDISHFMTITEWDSYESIKKFAGNEYQKAKYYPQDKDYLLNFEEFVTHYETYDF